MIELKDFSIGYGDRLILEEVDTIFPDSCLTALIGRNGSGKSTLLRALGGLRDNYTGRIMVDGENLRKMSLERLSKTVAIVTTNRPRIANMTCGQLVEMGRTPHTDWLGRMKEEDRSKVEESLKDVGMRDFFDRRIDSLSDGEFQRVMIARALAQDTRVIILDEPTSFLDMPSRLDIVRLLGGLAHERGKSLIFSTHELDLASDNADRIALIHEKKLINLPSRQFMAENHIQKIFNQSGS